MPARKLQGTVVSTKNDKTVVVQTERVKQHPLYRRRFKVHTKYKAHDESSSCAVGDTVVIEECRPYSKDKTWRVIETAAQKVAGPTEETPSA